MNFLPFEVRTESEETLLAAFLDKVDAEYYADNVAAHTRGTVVVIERDITVLSRERFPK